MFCTLFIYFRSSGWDYMLNDMIWFFAGLMFKIKSFDLVITYLDL